MLLDLIRGYVNGDSDFLSLLLHTVFIAIIVLIALSAHELAHGYIAYKLGDPTARNLGRLTMDPSKHLDPVGTISMLIFGFGWAKPVPINTRYFRNPRRDMALSAFAGPIMNLIISFVAMLIYSVLNAIFAHIPVYSEFAYNIMLYSLIFFVYMHQLNLYLAVFNLIPVPPLDGSRILFIFLPDRFYFGVMRYERYISLAIMLLLFSGALSGPLNFVTDIISNGMYNIIRLIPGL